MSWNEAWEPYSRHQYPSVDKAEGRWHNSRTDRRGRYDRRPVACQPRHHDSGDRGGTHRLDALEFWNHSRDVYLAYWSGSQMLYQPLTPMFVMVVQEQTMTLVQGVIQDADQVKFIRSRF